MAKKVQKKKTKAKTQPQEVRHKDFLDIIAPAAVKFLIRPRMPSPDRTDRLSGLIIKKTSSPPAVLAPCPVSWLIPMS